MSLQDRARQVIDARLLEPPEPFVLTFEALDTLAPGEKLLLQLYREPHPLYRALQQNGYRYATERDEDGTVHILIWKDA